MWPAVAGLILLAAEAELVTVRPADTGVGLRNPGMGWVLHYYDNVPAHYGSRLAPSDTVDDFPGLTCLYLRIPWSYLEPEEGRFDWSVLDTPAQRWLAKGLQIGLRISCTESWLRWATPQWVAEAGAKGYDFTPGREDPDGPYWEPEYDDPVFLAKLDAFLAALAARYDGRPEVAFIDVGSFGVWGEGHTWASTQRRWPAETVIRHIDLHRKHFRHTLLAANDDFGFQGEETIRHAAEHGLTLRDDSILVQGGANAYFHANYAQAFWPRVPVILESEHYGGSVDRGHWQDGSLYLRAVEEYHASYASIHWWPREFLERERPLIERINRRLGYRLQCTEAAWPAQVRVGGRVRLAGTWRNAGVAPCLPGGRVAWTLKDADGGIVAVLVDSSFDVRSLPVAEPGAAPETRSEAEFGLPFQCPSGTFDLFVSVGDELGSPRIALPLDGDDGARRYRLGRISVVGDYAVELGELQIEGGLTLAVVYRPHAPLPPGVRPFLHLCQHEEILATAGGDLDLTGAEPVEHRFAIGLPDDAAGQSYDVYLGLWQPANLGPEERLIPDADAGARRVLAGRLSVGADGTVRWQAR